MNFPRLVTIVLFIIVYGKNSIAQPTLGDDRLVCNGQYTTLDAGANGPYLWSTGETTRTIDVYQSGTYWAESAGKRDSVELTIYYEKYNQASVWPIGSNSNIAFDTASPFTPANLPLTNNYDIPAGSSSAVNDEGKLLFFSDGKSLFDRNGKLIESDFAGDPLYSQNSILVPKPGSQVEYFLFTINSTGLHYSVLQLNNDQSVTVKQKNVLLKTNVDEKITAVKNEDGAITWIMVHGKSSNTFYAYKLTNNGVDNTPIQSSTGTETKTAKGYLKFSTDGTRLAMAADFTELYYFDKNSGRVVFNKHLFHASSYGVEFSPDGTYLYVTTSNQTKLDSASAPTPGGSLLKINISYGYNTEIVHQGDASTVFGALQVGPDEKIYVVSGNNSTTHLGVITKPDDYRTLSGYVKDGYRLPGTSTLGLPNFPMHYFTKPGNYNFYPNFPCEGDSVFIKGVSRFEKLPYAKFSVFYNLGDPASGSSNFSTLLSPSHFYNGSNRSYRIEGIAKNTCRIDTVRRNTFIFPQPKINISDTSLCAGAQLPQYMAGTYPPLTTYYYWMRDKDTLSTAQSFRPPGPGRYHIKMVVGGACDTTDFFNVTFTEFPSVELGAAKNICESDSVKLTTTANPVIYTIKWSNNATSQSIYAKTTGRYWLTVSDSYCSVGDSVDVRLFPKPMDPGFKNDTIGCAKTRITFDAKNASGYAFLWSNGKRNQTLSTDSAGIYSVVISNAGCSDTFATKLTYLPGQIFSLSKAYALCEKESELLTLSAGAGKTWLWSPGNETSRNKTVTKAGSYAVIKTDSITDCKEEFEFKVVNICTPQIYFPNAFTPNADLHNNVFKPAASNLAGYKFHIFNRWGDLIYSTINYDDGWDGTYKGLTAPVDNYVYTYEYEGETLDGPIKFTGKGSFILLK